MVRHLAAFGLALLAAAAPAEAASLKDPAAVYFDDLKGFDPVLLKATTTTPVYASRTLNAHVGNLLAGDEVRLLAHSDSAYLIRATRGKPEGWVRPDALTAVDPSILKTLRQAVEEEARYKEAIRKKDVLPGMTFEHVLASLGQPDKKSFREDENGRFDIWSYVTYDTVVEWRYVRDQYTGRLVQQPVRVKVPVGSLDIEFKSGRVSALEQTEGAAPDTRNRLRTR